MFDYDVCIIGGGILGCMAARNLMRYRVSAILIEKQEDFCGGISKGNTAILYSGYDNKPGTLKSKLCVKANAAMDQLCRDLQVPIKRCGSLMVCHGPKGASVLEKKYENGLQSQVPGLQMLTGKEVLQLEPALVSDIYLGLYSPTTATLQPWDLVYAAAEHAMENGCHIRRSCSVVGIDPIRQGSVHGYCLQLQDHAGSRGRSSLRVRGVINCAGLYADAVREMVFPPSIRIFPQKADYLVFDRSLSDLFQHIIFEEPEEKGKGLTLVPTITGNLLVGPSQQPAASKDSFASTREGLDFLQKKCREVLPSLPLDRVIRNFSSLRPNPFDVIYQEGAGYCPAPRSIHSFVIDHQMDHPGFYSLIGVKTPGLTCSDELTRYVTAQLCTEIGNPRENPNFDPVRRNVPIRPQALSEAQRAALIRKDPSYGKIICQCHSISEGEILDAISRGAVSPDGVKRRCGTGMGPCQGSRCSFEIRQLLSKKLGIPVDDLL